MKNIVSYLATVCACVRACERVCVRALVYILLNDVSVLKFISMLKVGNFDYIYEPRHEISDNVVCATSKGSDQPAHTRSLIRAFDSRLKIIGGISYYGTSFGVSKLKEMPHRLV